VPEMMNTREVAEYLRLKERKVYELVAARLIPCTPDRSLDYPAYRLSAGAAVRYHTAAGRRRQS
jgi:hypothetical protein